MFKIDVIKFTGRPVEVYEDIDNYIKSFKQEFKLVSHSSGAYAHTYKSKLDSEVIVKIGDPKDDPYWAYVKALSTTRTRNPVLPILYHAIHLQGTVAEKYIVVMERLRHARYGKEHNAVEQFADIMLNCINKQGEVPMVGFRLEPQIQEALYFVNNVRKRNHGNHWFDLHDQNWMFRGNQIVLTDPLA